MPVAWSTNTVAVVYRLNVRGIVIWAIKPGVGEIIWSTETISPGLVGTDVSEVLSEVLDRHGRLVALPYMQAEHTGMAHVANLRGIRPLLAMICIFLGDA